MPENMKRDGDREKQTETHSPPSAQAAKSTSDADQGKKIRSRNILAGMRMVTYFQAR